MENFKIYDDLFLKMYPHPEYLDEIKQYIKAHKTKINFYLKLCNKGKWKLCLKQSPIFKLCLVYLFLPTVKERYKEKGISDEIFFDTMSDIKIWIDDHRARENELGLYELNWIMLHMELDIFKLGRLQFQKSKYYFSPTYNKNGISIKFGDKAVNVHIPRGEKLDIEKCKESLKMAEDFFKKFYPDYPTDFFMCHSWMLYSGNKNFMKKDSNILKFADMFHIVNELENPSQAYLWIFGTKIGTPKLILNKKKTGSYGYTNDLPQNSSLQKSAIKYINSGGKLGDTMGILINK